MYAPSPHSPARVDFSIMMGCTPEIDNRHTVCTLWDIHIGLHKHCTVLCTHCTVLVGKSSTRLDVEDVAEDLVVALLQPVVHLAQLVCRDQLHVKFYNLYFCFMQGRSQPPHRYSSRRLFVCKFRPRQESLNETSNLQIDKKCNNLYFCSMQGGSRPPHPDSSRPLIVCKFRPRQESKFTNR